MARNGHIDFIRELNKLQYGPLEDLSAYATCQFSVKS